MSPQQSSAQKICVICHQDCSARPRVKDKKGRYYCRQCYEDARQRKHAQTAAPTPPPPPASPMDDGDELGLLEELAQQVASAPTVEQQSSQCPSCKRPMPPEAIVCVGCGYNRRLGQHVSPAVMPGTAAAAPAAGRQATGGGIGVPAVLTQPWVVFVGPVLLFFTLALVGRENAGALIAYLVLSGVFVLGVGVWVLVMAFCDSIGTGVLTLCVPFYALYFVFGKNDNPYLKAACGAALMNSVIWWILVPLSTLPGQ